MYMSISLMYIQLQEVSTPYYYFYAKNIELVRWLLTYSTYIP